ncbi:MAG: anthranilate synthase component I [Gammaproteobacteria bacterium]|nr:anthranilate synthase component I [Gammaproteobacteria bacterium]
MNQDEFQTLTEQGYNRIPLTSTVFGDMDTPLSVYRKLADAPFSYLFESAASSGDRWSRYSIIGLPATRVLRVVGRSITVEAKGEVIERIDCDDPLEYIEAFQRQFRVPDVDGMPRFFGGLVGYFGYDTIRYIEKRLRHSTPPDDVYTPDILLMVSDEVVVFDNLTSHVTIIVMIDPSEENAWANGQARLDEISRGMSESISALPTSSRAGPIPEEAFESGFGREAFMDAVERTREYIRAGDVMQVVLAQRMTIPFEIPSIQLYRALRSLNPSPYMYFMRLDDFHIVGSSPEILAQVENGKVVNRPLAGTRRRGRDEEEDRAMAQELIEDPKEIAEHLMLVDLGRNDLGRVCKIGTVRVTEQFKIERYAHVFHIASHVEGDLADDKTAIDVLRATLPVGTLSGAPKIRAMEIIDELEPVKRGVYAGAVGYLAWNGNLDMAIAIRTAVIKDQCLYIETGAGIVADSIPELEWKECMNKARSLFQAASLAQEGIR